MKRQKRNHHWPTRYQVKPSRDPAGHLAEVEEGLQVCTFCLSGSFPDGDDTIYIFIKITLVCLFMLNALGLDSMTGKF